jgi:hypothetical protein
VENLEISKSENTPFSMVFSKPILTPATRELLFQTRTMLLYTGYLEKIRFENI